MYSRLRSIEAVGAGLDRDKVPGQKLPDQPIRGEFGPIMTLNPGGKTPAVHCAYIRNANSGRVPRKLLNLSIATRLLNDFIAVNSWPMSFNQQNFPPVMLKYNKFGKPRLKVGKSMSMAVSFSRVSDMLWACLSGPGNDLGLDAARAEEFDCNYPFRRAFHPEELGASIIDLHGINESAALLWSVKEAVVKALGTGYGLLGPLDIRIESMEDCTTYYIPRISIASKKLRTIGFHSSPYLDIISFSQAGTWVSLAVLPDDTAPGKIL